MPDPFFPDPAFGWTFYAVLVILCAIASYLDLRKMRVPNPLTITALSLGIVFNIARGVWLASTDQELWWLETGNVWLGALDGFLLALMGFLLAFGILFAMWVMGTCGGGDLKLMSAVGAWLGPMGFTLVFAGTMAILIVAFAAKLVGAALSLGDNPIKESLKARKRQRAARTPAEAIPPHRRLTYSLPVAIAVAVFVFWRFRDELRVVTPKAESVANTKAQAHAN